MSINKKIWNLFNIVFLIIFLFITFGSLFTNQAVSKHGNPMLLLISTFIVLTLWIFLFIKWNKKSINQQNEKKYFILIFSILLLFQLICSYELAVNPSNWDFGSIFESAKNLAIGQPINNEYFNMCSNNIFPMLFLALFFKISSVLGIGHYLTIGILLNILLIDLGIMSAYLIVRKIFNNKISLLFLIICLFISPLYLYAPIFYTDTLSLIFPTTLILIYLHIKDINEFNVKKNIYIVIFGLISFIAIKLKATTAIVIVAIFIDILLSKKNKNIIVVLFSIITYLLFNPIYLNFVNKTEIFNFDISNKSGFPTTHYLMMGLSSREINGRVINGIFNEEEVKNTLSISDYNQREQYNIKVIKSRLNDLGVIGTIKFMYKKTLHNFGDGTYFAPEKLILNPKNKNNIFKDYVYENSKYFDLYYYFAQGVQIAMLLLMTFGSLLYLKNNKYEEINVFRLSTFGIFCFLLMWESRSRYLVNYVLIMFICIIPSLEYIGGKYEKRKN